MKKSFLKKLKSFIGIIIPISSISTFVISCSQKSQINAIELFSESDNIRPGETKIVRAIALPDHHRISQLKWEIIDCLESYISISSAGRLSISPDAPVMEPKIITVQASLKNNAKIKATTQLTLLPEATHTFQGFDGGLEFVNREGEIGSVPIILTQDNVYETEGNVDVFMGRQSIDIPKHWTSLINFVPLVGGDVPNYMSFSIEGGDYVDHAIQWSDYDDESWVKNIPFFETINSTNLYEDVIVQFSCDPDITLIIHMSAWQDPTLQTSPGIISFISPEPDEIHSIDYLEEGKYRFNIFCPALEKRGIISDTYHSIYCYRPKYQYTEFTFSYDQELYDDEIYDMFTYFFVSEPELVERRIDHIRAYKFDVSYKMDLELKEHTYEHWNYKDQKFGTFYANDPMFGPAVACEVWLRWVL